ncbi:MAG: sulfite exporter TauE/SafE family protein [Burkholderiales bacterium]
MDGWLLVYLGVGSLVGFLAGLFGVGGGAMSVPLFVMMFRAQNFPKEHLVHVALGTSLTAIIFTSMSSLRAHHQHGAVNWTIVKHMAPGLLLGTFLGSQVAALMPTRMLTIVFVVFIYYLSVNMFTQKKAISARTLPGALGTAAVGAGVGAVSSMVAAGGGFLTIPFMTWCNVKMHDAIGTSSALGFPIALAGGIGYIVAGWNAQSLPPHTIGYVYWPLLACFVVSSMIMAPFGARLSHKTDVSTLRKWFAVLLAGLATKMMWSLF